MHYHTLHLRRRIGEIVVIGEHPNQVIVTLGEETDGQTNLIFKAPRDIPIDRLEVAKRKGLVIFGQV